MKKPSTSTLETKEPTNALVPLPQSGSAVVYSGGEEFAELAGLGLENVSTSDLLIPRITILQSLSPQLQRNKSEYIEGAQSGDLCDVGLGELLPKPLWVLPVYFKKQWLEWAPRASNKGLVAMHDTPAILDDTRPNDRGRPTLPNGNYIAETAQFYVLNLSCGGRKSFLPMVSTQLRKSRKWLMMATSEKVADGRGGTFTPPLFFRTYMMTTVPESNAEGSWEGWKIDRGPALPDVEGYHGLLDDAKAFRAGLSEGSIQADVEAVRAEIDSTVERGDSSRM